MLADNQHLIVCYLITVCTLGKLISIYFKDTALLRYIIDFSIDGIEEACPIQELSFKFIGHMDLQHAYSKLVHVAIWGDPDIWQLFAA
jgi:hypothetical protein